MTCANPAVLPFLVPSVPEPFVQHIYATQPDATSTPLAVQLHNLPPCTSSAHLITALQLALHIKDASQLLASVDMEVKKPDALLQVEGGHPKSSSSSTTIPSLFVHSAGRAVQEQHSSPASATIHCTSKSIVSKLLSSWAHVDQADLPRWPQSHILSHADLYEMQRPLTSTACKHADAWMDSFEAQPNQQQQQEADPATLSNRAKKRLAAQETQADKVAKKQAKQAARALDKGDEQAGEWTVVSYAGGKQPKQKQTVLSTQAQPQPQAKAKGKKDDVKGFKVDNAGNVSESGDKKSKFMPANFYKPKKEEQRKQVLGDLQSKFSQDKAKAAAIGNKSDSRRFKPY